MENLTVYNAFKDDSSKLTELEQQISKMMKITSQSSDILVMCCHP